MCDIMPEILDEVWVWIVGHEHLLRTLYGTDETRKASTSSELQHCPAADQTVGAVFQVVGDGAARVPEIVALVTRERLARVQTQDTGSMTN